MRIFVSYAHEDFAIADAIAVGLSQDGHDVFFDRDRLPAAEGYHARIRESIRGADLVVFLVSPSSVEASGYALTELALARERWPNPSGRVLPVMARPVETTALPAYLGAVTVLHAKGDLVADVLARVAEIAAQRRKRRLWATGGAIAAAAIAAAVPFALRDDATSSAQPEPCYLLATVKPLDPTRAPLARGSVDVLHEGTSASFPLSAQGEASIHVGPLTAPSAEWRIRVTPAGEAALGEATVRGCPQSPERHPMGQGFEVTLGPR